MNADHKLQVAAPVILGWRSSAAPRSVGFEAPTPANMTMSEPAISLPPEGHVLVVGPTGSGKGVGSAVPILMSHPGAAIVVDVKGELSAITRRAREAMGQRIVVLDPMRITERSADCFDPLALIDPTADDAVDEVCALVQILASAQTGGGKDIGREPFWQLRAQHLLVGVALLVREQGYEGDHSLMAVRRLVDAAAAEPKALARRLELASHPEARQVACMLQVAAEVTVGGIVSVAQSMVDFLRGDQVGTPLSATTFDPGVLTAGEPITIYLVMPPHMLESHGRLMRLWLAALLGCVLHRRARPRLSTLLMLDECAALGELPQLRQAITLLRGYGLQTVSYWQDMSQLRRCYPLDWPTMVNNCQVLQFHRPSNLAAAQEIADAIGGVDPMTLLRIPAGEAVFQLAGEKAVVARLPDYRVDVAYEGRHDPNPYHDTTRTVMPAPRARRVERTAQPLGKRHRGVPEPLVCPGLSGLLEA